MKSHWLRNLLIGLGVLVLLVAAVLTYLVATFDPNAYKGLAIDAMKKKYDRILAIDGPIKLSVFPSLAVQVSEVRLSEKGRTELFMAFDEAALSVAVMPLLRKQVVIDRVRAKGLEATYARDAKGVSNIDDLLSPADSKTKPGDAPADPTSSSSALRFDVSSVELESLRLTLRDDLAKRNGNIVVKSLTTGRLADGAEAPVKLDAQLALTSPAVQGSLNLDTKLTFDSATKNLRLRETKLQVAMGGPPGAETMNLNLDWPDFALKDQAFTGSGFSGRVGLKGDVAVDAEFKTGTPSGNMERIAVPNVETTVKGKSGPRQIAGTVKSSLNIDVSKGALALDALNAQLQVQEPSLQPLSINVQGKADASSQAAHWALKGQINNNPFTSDGTALLSTQPLTLNVAANFQSLDLNRLLPSAPPANAASAPANAPPAPDKPVDLSALRSVQGKFDVRVGQFAYQSYRVNDFVLAALIERGVLRVNQLAGKTWSGTVAATAMVDSNANRMSVKGAANNVNVNALLKDVAKKDVLEGTGRVEMDVDTTGRSVNELKSKLNGKAALQLRDGAVKGVNLAKSFRQAKSVLNMKQADERQQARQTEKTDFSELNASFNIANGVARSTDLDAKSPFLRLGGDGALDIGKGVIDYTARATVADTSKGQDGADLAALKGLTVPVHLTGPFEAIAWQIQWSAVAAQALKTQVGEQVKGKLLEKLGLPSAASSASGTSSSDAAKDAAKDKLKKELKGLFK